MAKRLPKKTYKVKVITKATYWYSVEARTPEEAEEMADDAEPYHDTYDDEIEVEEE